MKVVFNLNYSASQAVVLNLTLQQACQYTMVSKDGYHWTFELEIALVDVLEYSYSVGDIVEWGRGRKIQLIQGVNVVSLNDSWREKPNDTEKYTSAFGGVFYKKSQKNCSDDSKCQVELIVNLTDIDPCDELVMVGENDRFGSWNAALAPRFRCGTYPYWHLKLSECDVFKGLNYKFAIVKSSDGSLVRWEEGGNRLWMHDVRHDEYCILNDLNFRGINDYKWRGAGVAIPVFSLRSDSSAGIGDFADLAHFAQWTASMGGRVVQILPINDTTITHTSADSYPYNAISVFALHPLYLSLERMGVLQDVAQSHIIAEQLQNLNYLEQLDYSEVDRVKWQFFRAMYLQDGEQLFESQEYKQFFEQNKEWLIPYAVFSFLRDLNGTADYSRWGQWEVYDKERAQKLLCKTCGEYHNVAIYLYLQYHLHTQLLDAKKTAAAVGVAIKGDIPIGVSRFSVDTWVDPHLFNLQTQAGAPPDAFAQEGQNWGFPTYNWEAMANEGYLWWKRRFEQMSRYFHLYRIDHILGFFRIWQIPSHSLRGLLGHFSPALPYSVEELKDCGFIFNANYARPNFSRTELKDVLGKYRNFVNEYFEMSADGLMVLKEQFDTQRKLKAQIDDQGLVEVLMIALEDVLFVNDDCFDAKYHPRIDGAKTLAYRRLNQQQQRAYDRLYEDYFYQRHNDFWANGAMAKLPVLIGATGMMCCAEDLGMIPDSVAGVLSNLQVVTLEIERMPKLLWERFGNMSKYQYMSVCSSSTHDISPLRLWWQEISRDEREYYFREISGMAGDVPMQADTELCREIVGRNLSSPSILTILPLQDWFSINANYWSEDVASERINIPSDPSHYWRYRMPVTIENLEQDISFGRVLRGLIADSGRR